MLRRSALPSTKAGSSRPLSSCASGSPVSLTTRLHGSALGTSLRGSRCRCVRPGEDHVCTRRPLPRQISRAASCPARAARVRLRMRETVEEIARPPVTGGTVLSDTRHEIRPRSVTAFNDQRGSERKDCRARCARARAIWSSYISLIRAMYAGDRGSDHLFAVCVYLSPAGKRAIDRVECEGFQNLRHPPNLGGGEGD